MNKKNSPLHEKIARDIGSVMPAQDLKIDKACGGRQRIPLFCDNEKSRKTEFCNVDLLILKRGKIKAIVGIEESNVKPTQICGKFLTSVLAKYYIHEKGKNQPVEMDNHVTFFQIVDSSKLKGKSAKPEQWKILEKSIQSVLPLTNSSIKSYKLFTKEETDQPVSHIKQII